MSKTEQKTEQAMGVKGLRSVKGKCIVCGVEYDAGMITIDGKDTGKITPPRCPKHQTAHLTELRVDKTVKDISLIGNLKARLTPEQRQQVIDSITAAVAQVQAKFDSALTVEKVGFRLQD